MALSPSQSAPCPRASYANLPAELRLAIYTYLLDDGGNHWLRVRSFAARRKDTENVLVRSHYCAPDSQTRLRSCRATYGLGTKDAIFHTALMSVNRQAYTEMAHILYAGHSFDFGSDIEAVVPFFQDRLKQTRALITRISVQKLHPALELLHDRQAWARMCQFLAASASIKKIRLAVEGVRLEVSHPGPAEYSMSDFELLLRMKHSSLDWVQNLSWLRGVDDLEVVPRYLENKAYAGATAFVVYSTYSSSIERGLTEILKAGLGITS